MQILKNGIRASLASDAFQSFVIVIRSSNVGLKQAANTSELPNHSQCADDGDNHCGYCRFCHRGANSVEQNGLSEQLRHPDISSDNLNR